MKAPAWALRAAAGPPAIEIKIPAAIANRVCSDVTVSLLELLLEPEHTSSLD
jgi:hypothetical protein